MELPSNVDAQEIDHYDQVATTWWDAHGAMGTLHTINPLRMEFITQGKRLDNLAVLDVGCGGGILSEALARAGARVTGIDLSQSSIIAARRHAVSQGLAIDYQYASLDQNAGQNHEAYDIVTCMEMLEHVPNPEEVISNCSTVLKPGGQAYFSTINRSVKALLFAIIAGEYILNLLPKGSHHYRRLIRPGELKAWAGRNSLAFIHSASLMYNPLTRRFKLEQDREDVNYLAQFSKQR